MLVARGIDILGFPSHILQEYQLDQYDRPYLSTGPEFNFSHTRERVSCVLSTGSRVGIDIEYHQPVDLADYRRVFTPEEWEFIQADPAPLLAFYTQWTKKEAVMKADGRGFQLDPASFGLLEGEVLIDGNNWKVQLVEGPKGYTTHLATKEKVTFEYYLVRLSDLFGRT